MSVWVRNIFSVVLAIGVAAIVGSAIVILGHSIIPVPEGIDTNDIDSLRSNFHLFELKHFLFPLLAHALGTFAAAYVVSRFAGSHHLFLSLGLGIIFMLASLALSFKLGHWPLIGIIDIVQYIPVSFLGYYFGRRITS